MLRQSCNQAAPKQTHLSLFSLRSLSSSDSPGTWGCASGIAAPLPRVSDDVLPMLKHVQRTAYRLQTLYNTFTSVVRRKAAIILEALWHIVSEQAASFAEAASWCFACVQPSSEAMIRDAMQLMLIAARL